MSKSPRAVLPLAALPLAALRRRIRGATALSPLGGGAMLAAALLLAAMPAAGQDGAPPTPAPNPVVPVPGDATTLDYGANGVPVVKIATPDAKGTSYNRYQSFNVDARGVVLNNSDTIVQSRLAGYIDGNAQLKAAGGASLIINEVVAANPSSLGGYIEIAGKQADLVLANPYGISCNGCGFVNAPRVTLAAAAPLTGTDGSLAGFRATTGKISVGGRGLDATTARLDLFARAISINAGLYADTVTASFGAGDVNRDGDVVVGQRNPAQADQPAFALDIAALGGMYARSIRLIGTERGLGVNVSGELAGLEQGVTLSTDGKVSITGAVTAKTEARIDAGTLDVAGKVYGEGKTVLAATSLTGGGLIGSGGDLSITAGSVTSGGTLAAGLARDGRITQTGALALDIGGAGMLSGRVLAHDALSLTAGTIANTGLVSGAGLRLRAGSLDNSGGVIDARSVLDAQAAAITNVGGAIQSSGALTLAGSSLDNQRGTVLALGDGTLTLGVTGLVANTDGQIGGNGDVAITAGELGIAGANGSLTAAKGLALTIGNDFTVTNEGLVASGGTTNLMVGGTAGIADGGLQSGGALTLRAGVVSVGSAGQINGRTLGITANGALTNAGLIASAGPVALTAGSLTNNGTIAGDGGLTLGIAGTLAQNGMVASDGGIAIDTGRLTSLAGTIEAGGALTIAAGSVALDRANLLSTGSAALALTSSKALTATGSRLGGNGDVAIRGGTIDLTGTRVTALGGLTLESRTGDLALSGSSTLENGGDLTLGAAGTLAHSADIIGRGQNLTLTAGRIDNRGAAILHLGSGTLALTSGSTIDNAGGRIATNGVLSLGAVALGNGGGTITAANTATLTISGDVGNETGLIAAGGGLGLRAGGVRNAGGTIQSSGALDARLGSLNGGTLAATGATGKLTIDVNGAVDGGSTLIGATGDATISAGSFDLGPTSRLTAGGTLMVTARDAGLALGGGQIDAAKLALSVAGPLLTGDGSVIQSTGTLTIDTGALVTGGGRIAAGGALRATTGSLDNRGGVLVSGIDGATLTVGTLLNGGTLGGDGDVTVNATAFDNGIGVLAAGGDLRLETVSLGNAAGGQIWADRDARVTAAQTLTNRGSIAAARELIINAGALDGGSGTAAGTLAGGRLLSITSGGGTAGRLIAPNSLTLGISGDLVNAAGDSISTPGALTLTIGGSFVNAGSVEGGTAINLTATGALTNQTGGSIVAPVLTLIAGTTLENQGLINGGVVTLRGSTIANGGAIFGDSVGLFGAGGIINAGADAVIATRAGLLSLSSGGDIVNRDGALLYSLGDLSVTGAGGVGRAGSVQNLSADIQAQGNIAIAATRLVNDRAVFTTEEALLSARHVENVDSRGREDRTITEFDEAVTDTQVTADSGAARIIGGNITIDADSVANNISTISAANSLNVGAAAVSNTAFTGFNTTTQNGTIRDQHRSCFLFFCGGYNTRSTTPFTTVDAQPTFTIASTITAGGTLTIDAVTIDNLVLTPGGGTADIFAANASAGTVMAGGAVGAGALGTVTAPGAAPGSVVGSGIDPTFGFAVKPIGDLAGGGTGGVTLDLGGLFKFADSTSQFLVGADARFTNYNNFLSSDYFLDQLGYDPARVQRRLGDGLYEQQLITNQLVALIGAQRLVGYGDNQAQYRALLDAGATYARTYNIGLGVALSAAQMATLTSDIVLLVETTVQTPSGPQTVLAPRVYLTKAAAGDLTSGGAIIAGRDLQLRASDSFANVGVVRATASSTLVGGTITNSGRLDLGGIGIVSASGDLIDRSGLITGGDLTLAAGRDLRLEPVATTRTVATRYYAGRSDQQVSLTTTTTNRGTDIAATGNVDLLAGRTLSVTGASVAAGGNLSAYAGQNIAIGAATDSGTVFAIGREGKTQFTQTQTEQSNILSNLRAGGDITLATPGALAVTGGAVTAGGALTAQGGSIDVAGVVDSSRLQRDTLKKTGGFLSSTKTTTKYDGTDQTVVSSTLSGNTVALLSTGDTQIAGSNVVADNGVAIAAGGAIDIGTLTATDREQQSTSIKKSGISLSGSGLFIGVAKTQNDTNTTSVTNTGSLIGSTAGDVTVDAGRALSVTGSQIAGSGLTRLTGESVAISNATDVTTTDTLSKSSSIGLSIGIQSPVLSGLQGVRDAAQIVGNSNANMRTTAVAGIAGGLAAYNAADALNTSGGNLASLSVTFGISSSKATSSLRDETSVASRIAGNDVAIAARGADAASTIAVRGSEIIAARDLSLTAPGAITLTSGTETDTLAQANTSSGFSIGVQIGLNGVITPSASLTLGKGNASGTDVRQVESILSAGNTVSIATPDALTLKGAQVSGNRINIDAGSLAIISEQDRAIYAERQRNLGLSVSAANGGSIAGNLTNSRQNGDFASVREQSGIYAGQGGYGITVAGNTNLVGGVIASEAAAAQNRLTTGTLTASDLANREQYSASSLSIGGGIGGIGKNADGEASAGTDQTPGSALPGIRTGIGTISATPPVALGASGKQAGTTLSAIAPGAIDITTGDVASQATAATISRDTTGANTGELTQAYDANKREEIALGFAAATQLANQTGTFFANRAQQEAALREQAASGIGTDGRPLSAEQRAQAQSDADRIKATFGAGSAVRIIATAVNGAAGSNVTGSFNSLIQASAVNVLQSLGVSQIKTLADGLGARNPDGSVRTNIDGSVVQTVQSEALRGALQALAGCAGAAAGGSGGCGGAAVGAGASVALNLLLNGLDRDDPRDKALRYDADGRPINQSTLEQQEARSSLVATVVAAIASGAGLNVGSAVNAAQIETENNQLNVAGRVNRASFVSNPTPAQLLEIARNWSAYFASGDGTLVLQAAQGNEELAKTCLATSGAAGCGAVQRRLDGLRANFASDTIASLAGDNLNNQQALGQIGYEQLTELGRYKAAVDALSPTARAALIESLRTTDPSDAGANLLGFLVSPETSVNLAASLAQLQQSGVGRTVTTLVQFDEAFKRGFLDQGKDTIVGLATLIGQTVRFGADTSALGDAGDLLSTVYREQFGKDLPPSVAALVPSSLRGEASAAYLRDLGAALGTYAQTRAQDPDKFHADVLYVVNKYSDEFGATYAEAEAEGTLGAFYGEIAGRVAFEIATIILPTKLAKVARAGDAVEGLVATSRAVDEAVDAAKLANSRAVANAADTPIPRPIAAPEIEIIDVANVQRGTREYELLNNPPPNTEIRLSNGNVYHTNAAGIVDEVTFEPRLIKQPRDARQTAVGREGLDTDVGGHIQACSLGGTCDRVNLFPQDANFNNSAYKKFENVIRKALEDGQDVGQVKIKFERTSIADPRPTTVSVEYTINGVTRTRLFDNKLGN